MAAPLYPGTGISSEQHACFERDGYLVLKEIFTADEIRAVRVAADRAEQRWLENPNRLGGDKPYLRRVEPLIEYADEFVDLLADQRFFPLLCELLGNGIAMLDTAYFISPPGKGWGDTSEWHIDEGLTGPVGSPIPLMVKVSIPLVDLRSLDDGPTAVIPGSHNRSFDENHPSPADPRDMPGKVPILASAGNVYIFHGRIHHAAMPNVGTQVRRVLHLNYGHIWMKPWPGHEPSERLRSQADSPSKRQLLHVSDHHYQARLAVAGQ